MPSNRASITHLFNITSIKFTYTHYFPCFSSSNTNKSSTIATQTRTSFFPEMPTPTSLLSAYASISTSIMLFRTMFNQLFPAQLRRYVVDTIQSYWKPKSSELTLIINEKDDMTPNQMFDAAESYLSTKINPDSKCLRVTKFYKEKHINIKLAESEEIVDSFEGVSVTWWYIPLQAQNRSSGKGGEEHNNRFVWQAKGYMELKFEKTYKEIMISSYLPWVIKKAEELKNLKKDVKLHNLQSFFGSCRNSKESLNLDHPSTFNTLAMDPALKKAIIDDLNLFLKRRDFYKEVGKVWKRGYMLYGPPGTGKSSLIAAIANYIKFDVYDLQLSSVRSDADLRQLMLGTSNRSILVIEDIDCSTKLPGRNVNSRGAMFSLSGLLNFIDGLWSCCGDERIIIFTTNHKERLDSALLRPGRMDVHIHMSYLTIDGFKTLAANYLKIYDHHCRFKEIEELINSMSVTPAEVAEELMKSEDVDVALEGLVKFLRCKKMDENKAKDGDDNEDEGDDEDEEEDEDEEDDA